jgi:hypothetical protein
MKCAALRNPGVAGGTFDEFLAFATRWRRALAGLLKVANRLDELSDEL